MGGGGAAVDDGDAEGVVVAAPAPLFVQNVFGIVHRKAAGVHPEVGYSAIV